MYKWDIKKIKDSQIDLRVLYLIIERAYRVGIEDSLHSLKKENKIPPASNATYKRHLFKMAEFEEYKRHLHREKIERDNKVISLREKGMKVDEIVKKTGVKKNTVYYILKCQNFTKKDLSALNKAKNIIKIWEENLYEGRIMTNEVKDAYKLINS